ncbi:MAG: glycosyltransferase [Lachnospiraceae bacterium]|nr:glycosyltransferase [Lachnospiraceae bacterium]
MKKGRGTKPPAQVLFSREKNEKKKWLFVINTLGRAGAETALLELLRHLDEKENEISLLVMMGQGEMLGEIPEHVKLLNKKYSEKSVQTKAGRRKMYGYALKMLFKRGSIFRRFMYLCKNFAEMKKKGCVMPDKLLWRLIADGAPRLKEEFDVAVAYLEGGAAYYVADYVKAQKKVAFVHVDYEQAGYSRLLDKSCYENYDRIFTISGEVQESFLKIYPEHASKTRILHNLLDQELIRKKAEEAGGFTDDYEGIRLLTVGNLIEQKGYDVAIETMYLLKQANAPVRWYVIGEGKCRKKLEKKIEELGLKKDFLLLGYKENPYPWIKQCDLYVHATRYEGKSMAVQEAQVLGKAIVVSDCSGNREQICGGTDGVLCEFDAQKLKECIMQLAEDSALRQKLGEAAACKNQAGQEEIDKLLSVLE